MTTRMSGWAAWAVTGMVVLGVGVALGRALPPATANGQDDPPAPEPRASDKTAGSPHASRDGDDTDPARTPSGAVTAATAYMVALDGPGLFDEDRRERLIEDIAAAGARGELQTALGEVAWFITEHLGLSEDSLARDGFVWRPIPAGWDVRDFNPDRAEVAIWATGVAMAEGRPLAEPSWRTTVVEVVWERGGWRLVGFRGEPGPRPTGRGEANGLGVARAINRFQPFMYAPASGDSR